MKTTDTIVTSCREQATACPHEAARRAVGAAPEGTIVVVQSLEGLQYTYTRTPTGLELHHD